MSDLVGNPNYLFSHEKAHVFSEMGVMPEIAQAVEEMDWT